MVKSMEEQRTTTDPVKLAVGVRVQSAMVMSIHVPQLAQGERTGPSVPCNLVVFIIVNAFDDINLS